MEQITSRQNSVIQYVRKLAADGTFRLQEGEFLCEGPKLWQEALSAGWAVGTLLSSQEDILSAGERAAERTVRVPPSLLAYAADTQSPQEPLFTCHLPDNTPVLPGRRLLVLDGIQDPGNAGTIWRTADALGADGLIFLPECASPWSPKTVRATMGACFRLPVLQIGPEELFRLLDESDIPAYAAMPGPDAEDIRADAPDPAALIIGSEGRGISSFVLEHCTGRLTIPMRQRCESLNAAAAASVLLWEMWGRKY